MLKIFILFSKKFNIHFETTEKSTLKIKIEDNEQTSRLTDYLKNTIYSSILRGLTFTDEVTYILLWDYTDEWGKWFTSINIIFRKNCFKPMRKNSFVKNVSAIFMDLGKLMWTFVFYTMKTLKIWEFCSYVF